MLFVYGSSAVLNSGGTGSSETYHRFCLMDGSKRSTARWGHTPADARQLTSGRGDKSSLGPPGRGRADKIRRNADEAETSSLINTLNKKKNYYNDEC